jgi:tRNA threonylcarbamoyladenosine biosynthesis protein TsaE
MNVWEVQAASEQVTERLGALLAAWLPPQAIVALNGTLGAGKTRFVQALAVAAGVLRDDVVSPTFVICQEYAGQQPIYHLDLYRVKDEDEWSELGIEELFAQEAWVLMEWADRFPQCMPEQYLEIQIEVTGEESRGFRFLSHGEDYEFVLQELAARWK